MGNIFCQNTKCKHYFEDSCTKNLNGETIDISEDGRCENFEKGKYVGYASKPESMDVRKYIAVSIKHSQGFGLVLWGSYRTADDEERCFAGYQGTMDYDRCELYSLADFWEKYGNGVIKCDEPVPVTSDLTQRWKDYDTVLVDCREYETFVNRGLRRGK